jgi:hypothetical protein
MRQAAISFCIAQKHPAPQPCHRCQYSARVQHTRKSQHAVRVSRHACMQCLLCRSFGCKQYNCLSHICLHYPLSSPLSKVRGASGTNLSHAKLPACLHVSQPESKLCTHALPYLQAPHTQQRNHSASTAQAQRKHSANTAQTQRKHSASSCCGSMCQHSSFALLPCLRPLKPSRAANSSLHSLQH